MVLVAVPYVAASCNDATEPGPVVATVELSAPELAGLPGWTMQLTAVTRDSAGVEVPNPDLEWGALPPARAQIDSTGLLVFQDQPGTFIVFVREVASGAADTLTMRVAREGEVRWSVDVFGHQLFTTGGPALAPDGSIWVLSRVTDIDVPVSQDVGIVYRLSALGEIQCQRQLDGLDDDYVMVPPGGSGAWVVGQTVYHLSHDCTVERSVATEAPFGVFLSGAVDPDGRLFAAAGFHLLAFDAALVEQWRSPRDARASWLQPPTVTPERVYAKVTSDSLYAFDKRTGAVLWTQPEPDAGVEVVTFGKGPVVAHGRLYLPGRFSLVAYDTSGVKLWQTPNAGTGVSEPVVLADGRLINQTQANPSGGGLVMRDPSGGKLWERPEGDAAWVNWYGGPALAEGGVVYAAGLTGFYAFDLNGNRLWEVHTDAGEKPWFAGSPAIAPDGTVYTTSERRVYAIFGSHPPDSTSPWPMWRRNAQRTGWVP